MKIANRDSVLIALAEISFVQLDEGRLVRASLAALKVLVPRAGA
jgi:hypothetical protein